MPLTDALQITWTLNLFTAIMQPHVQSNEILADDAFKRIFAFCLAWGVAGLCEAEYRKMFHDKLVEEVYRLSIDEHWLKED